VLRKLVLPTSTVVHLSLSLSLFLSLSLSLSLSLLFIVDLTQRKRERERALLGVIHNRGSRAGYTADPAARVEIGETSVQGALELALGRETSSLGAQGHS